MMISLYGKFVERIRIRISTFARHPRSAFRLHDRVPFSRPLFNGHSSQVYLSRAFIAEPARRAKCTGVGGSLVQSRVESRGAPSRAFLFISDMLMMCARLYFIFAYDEPCALVASRARYCCAPLKASRRNSTGSARGLPWLGWRTSRRAPHRTAACHSTRCLPGSYLASQEIQRIMTDLQEIKEGDREDEADLQISRRLFILTAGPISRRMFFFGHPLLVEARRLHVSLHSPIAP